MSEHLCRKCGIEVGFEGRRFDEGSPDVVCAKCWAEIEAARRTREEFARSLAAVFGIEIAVAVEINQAAWRAGLILAYEVNQEAPKLQVRRYPNSSTVFSGTVAEVGAWIKARQRGIRNDERPPTVRVRERAPAHLREPAPARVLTTGLLDGLVISPLEKDGAITHLHLTVRDLPGLRIVLEVGAGEELRDALTMILAPRVELSPTGREAAGLDEPGWSR